MFLLRRAYIGEVSVTVWPKILKEISAKKNSTFLSNQSFPPSIVRIEKILTERVPWNQSYRKGFESSKGFKQGNESGFFVTKCQKVVRKE
jgi:hypothetical protein